MKDMKLVTLGDGQVLWSNYDSRFDVRVKPNALTGAMTMSLDGLVVVVHRDRITIRHEGTSRTSVEHENTPDDGPYITTCIDVDMHGCVPKSDRLLFPISFNEPIIVRTFHQVLDEQYSDFINQASKWYGFLCAERGEFATSYGTANVKLRYEVDANIRDAVHAVKCAMVVLGYQDFVLPTHIVTQFPKDVLELRESTTKMWQKKAAKKRKMADEDTQVPPRNLSGTSIVKSSA
ncbi:hypothetical protein PSEUBRA_005249 [Kalmanozyma brasiliensis GHG001]|uniref:uncharacterized protein n=1 Tax=Kalmanozyma brasiliensis (strain GHG001) TaxID=1365824 RepID=UPI002867DB13|nr:uncharacterized protein PSEUBRA_005249 [Kalmanozyma brasiliensis GHG001]KAF6767494.1 hypothetical protein PSEUBRA_005249 [Kalmanozyma brasiliensis GHG001]